MVTMTTESQLCMTSSDYYNTSWTANSDIELQVAYLISSAWSSLYTYHLLS